MVKNCIIRKGVNYVTIGINYVTILQLLPISFSLSNGVKREINYKICQRKRLLYQAV